MCVCLCVRERDGLKKELDREGGRMNERERERGGGEGGGGGND